MLGFTLFANPSIARAPRCAHPIPPTYSEIYPTADQHDPTFAQSTLGSTTSPFLSCDLSAAGTVLAAGSGTEHEARIELFDLRAAPTPLHAYTESHSDLVTTVAFHPTLDDRLLSGSADGLLATYDVRLSDEDEALIATGNVEASVARVRWTPDGRSIWASTDMETLSLWNSEDVSREPY